MNYTYKQIKYENTQKNVYSNDLNLYREANITNILDMPLGDIWKLDNSAIKTPLFKEEYLMGASMDSKIDINVSIDRGYATAFEKHLVLTECNTFEDLLNLRNNMFNL